MQPINAVMKYIRTTYKDIEKGKLSMADFSMVEYFNKSSQLF